MARNDGSPLPYRPDQMDILPAGSTAPDPGPDPEKLRGLARLVLSWLAKQQGDQSDVRQDNQAAR